MDKLKEFARATLQKYGSHYPSCKRTSVTGKCSCGLDDALNIIGGKKDDMRDFNDFYNEAMGHIKKEPGIAPSSLK